MNLGNAVASSLTEQTSEQCCKAQNNSHSFTMCTQGGRESHFAHTFKEEFELQKVLENICLSLLLGLLLIITAASVLLTFPLFLVNCCFLYSVSTREVNFIFLGCSTQKSHSVCSDY